MILLTTYYLLLSTRYVSDYTKEETPVPIPNTEVKLFMVDGTYLARDWESRMSLALFKKSVGRNTNAFFVKRHA